MKIGVEGLTMTIEIVDNGYILEVQTDEDFPTKIRTRTVVLARESEESGAPLTGPGRAAAEVRKFLEEAEKLRESLADMAEKQAE